MTEYQALLQAGASHDEAIEQIQISNQPTGLTMATTKPATTPATTDKPKKTPPTLVERTKAQLSTATLKAKVTIDDLTALESHIAKLKALLA